LAARAVVVIGASAGGLEALLKVIGPLPKTFAAAVMVVIHRPADAPTALPLILRRRSELEVVVPSEGDKIAEGVLYVAPVDRHMLVVDGRVRLARGPRVNHVRPAADVLFQTAARSFGRRAIGITLSGALYDGTAGLNAIKQYGGTAIVQDPEDALVPSMPLSAIRGDGAIDYVLPASEIGEALIQELESLYAEVGAEEPMVTDDGFEELIQRAFREQERGERVQEPAIFTCPECGGVMWEFQNGNLLQYRCHVGHTYAAEHYAVLHSSVVENALWVAVRTLEENAALSRRIETRLRASGHVRSAAHFEERSIEAESQATLIRSVIEQTKPPPVATDIEVGPEPPAAQE
jgi:two-component system chemotaxis response regulator CheB